MKGLCTIGLLLSMSEFVFGVAMAAQGIQPDPVKTWWRVLTKNAQIIMMWWLWLRYWS